MERGERRAASGRHLTSRRVPASPADDGLDSDLESPPRRGGRRRDDGGGDSDDSRDGRDRRDRRGRRRDRDDDLGEDDGTDSDDGGFDPRKLRAELGGVARFAGGLALGVAGGTAAAFFATYAAGARARARRARELDDALNAAPIDTGGDPAKLLPDLDADTPSAEAGLPLVQPFTGRQLRLAMTRAGSADAPVVTVGFSAAGAPRSLRFSGAMKWPKGTPFTVDAPALHLTRAIQLLRDWAGRGPVAPLLAVQLAALMDSGGYVPFLGAELLAAHMAEATRYASAAAAAPGDTSAVVQRQREAATWACVTLSRGRAAAAAQVGVLDSGFKSLNRTAAVAWQSIASASPSVEEAIRAHARSAWSPAAARRFAHRSSVQPQFWLLAAQVAMLEGLMLAHEPGVKDSVRAHLHTACGLAAAEISALKRGAADVKNADMAIAAVLGPSAGAGAGAGAATGVGTGAGSGAAAAADAASAAPSSGGDGFVAGLLAVLSGFVASGGGVGDVGGAPAPELRVDTDAARVGALKADYNLAALPVDELNKFCDKLIRHCAENPRRFAVQWFGQRVPGAQELYEVPKQVSNWLDKGASTGPSAAAKLASAAATAAAGARSAAVAWQYGAAAAGLLKTAGLGLAAGAAALGGVTSAALTSAVAGQSVHWQVSPGGGVIQV